MPNWSDTSVYVEGEKDAIKEVAKNIKEYGLNWGVFKQPEILSDYTHRCKVIQEEEWDEYLKEKEQSKEEITIKNSCLYEKISESKAKEFMDKYGAID